MKNYITGVFAVGIGAFIGANIRYWLSTSLPRWLPLTIGAEYATFFVNFTGSILLAIFLVRAERHTTLGGNLRLMIAVGFFGSYTTFSTFANEIVALAKLGDWSRTLIYLSITNIACILGVILGLWVGNRF